MLQSGRRKLSLRREIAQLGRDDGGTVLLYFTILMVVIFAFIGLAIEAASYVTVNNQQQALSDGAAVAGAKELDRNNASICRARDVAQNYLSNDPAWPWGLVALSGLQIEEPEFYGPGIDEGPLSYSCSGPGTLNANDHLAGFIRVTTVTRQLTPTFISAAVGAAGGTTGNARTAATAMAANDLVVCDIPPMYICNPFETAGMTYAQATAALENSASSALGRQIKLRRDPGNSNLAPGNFGFLNSPGTHGFNAVRDSIARIHTPACFKRSSVDLQTGFAGNSIAPAFNVRFDVYSGSMSGNRTDANYAPARNVRKGYWLRNGNNWCNAQPCTDNNNSFCHRGTADTSDDRTMGLPLDSGWTVADLLGNGNWNFELYWSKAHPGVAAPNGWNNTNRPSRYTVYLYEITRGANPGGIQDAACPNGASCPGTPTPQETGAPRCSAQTPPEGIDRRLMPAAVINCRALAPLNGSQDDVPVAGFGKFFLIAPVDDSQINAEIVDLISAGRGGSGTAAIAHRQIQLVR